MQDLVSEAKTRLHSENYRLTPQRTVIFEHMARHPGHHFTAEEIYDAVQAEHGQMGLSTVYRSLMVLEQVGLIRRLDVGDGVSRYEFEGLDPSPHCHLVCLQCGELNEAACPAVENISTILQVENQFEILDQSLVFFGFCRRCTETSGECAEASVTKDDAEVGLSDDAQV